MNARSQILHRIEDALRQPASRPPLPPPGPVFPPIHRDEWLPRFEKEFAALKGECHLAADWTDARAWMKALAERCGFRRVAISPDADVEQATQSLAGVIALNREDCGSKLADVDLGVTGCDCLVAMTGSVVLTAQTGFGRALSVLPPAHLVVARRSQLLPGLTDAIRLLQSRHGKMWPSMVTFITGASRTADIEKILVLGAHGPKSLFVLLLDF